MKQDDESVVVEQIYHADVDTVWSAITEVDQMRQWYFDNIPSFEAEVGFETQFNVQCEGRNYQHLWKVTEVVPKKKITYNWKFEGYAGASYVTFELWEQDESVALRLTDEVVESFQQDVPEFSRESCLAGWNYFIRDSLKAYLEKEK